VRRFWRGDAHLVPELATRLSGSSDLFARNRRGPWASVNFVTCHDGFTMRDLVSYEEKRNEANGEGNRDGSDSNWSRNWGEEGETEAVSVLRMRDRIQRNLLATLAFSQGVPMLSHGDEIGRTQRGNNNVYCQDSELSWMDWELDDAGRRLLAFTREVLRIRRENPVFRRRRFLSGGPVAQGVKDVSWLRPDGAELEDAEWQDPKLRVLGMLVHGEASDELDERGRPNRGDTLLLLVNASGRSRRFALPSLPEGGAWTRLVDTARPTAAPLRPDALNLSAHSLVLLQYGVPK
jgi:glycogen operon protein